MKRSILFTIFFSVFLFIGSFASAESMYSPTWGFFLDLPEGYEFADGDGRDRFSFAGPAELMFDLVVYNNRYASIRDLAQDVNRRISNQGEMDFFSYYGKQAAIFVLDFGGNTGYGLCLELNRLETGTPMLVALAYSPVNENDMSLLHLSALDSISPGVQERLCPGPIMEYSFPRGAEKNVELFGGVTSIIRENDAEAAQVLIEREFAVLSMYANTEFLQQAWIRYYRFIFRDSFDRIVFPALALARAWGGADAETTAEKRAFAQRALNFVQGFNYERNFDGSDFLNLVTAITERRGDCDSRAMLWAIILTCAEIRTGLMISHHYSHAMGLADIEGSGARFEAYGVRWLVAETTANIEIGLIAQDQSDPQHWFGVVFE